MAPRWIVSFPMYDFIGLEEAHDRLWFRLRTSLIAAGLHDAPRELTRSVRAETVWEDPALLIGQACEYPLARARYRVRLIATPRYTAPGCQGNQYRSAIVARAETPATTLEELKGSRCVINDESSNSGMNLLRACIAPLAAGASFFESVKVSGSHQKSIEAVVGREADVAAIDCVSLAHLKRLYPDLTSSIRVVAWTGSTPSLPWITSGSTSDALLVTLRAALQSLGADPVMALLRDTLFLDGFDVNPVEGFSEVLQLEQAAAHAGYARLH